MTDGKLYDVFLSHNGEDKEAVEELARRLEDEAQLKPWLDKWNLVPGRPWQEALEEALDASRACAVFLGPSGIGPWQNEEVRAALQERVGGGDFRVIPVLLPDADAPARRELPRFLSRLTWVDFRGAAGLKDEAAFRRLVAGIRGLAPGRHAGGLDGLRADDAGPRRRRRKALLILLTGFFAAASINLLADIAQRFLSGGSDSVSVVRNFVQVPLTALQAALALLAGGTLVEPGRAWVEKLLTRMGLYKNYGVEKLLLISVAAAVAVTAARLSLPFAASYYNDRGTRSLLGNDLTAAAYQYQRAISLNPDYAEARYGLASVYDRLHQYDEAIGEYDQALKLKSQFGQPRNNLARLYLLRGRDRQDSERALALVNEELERSPADASFLYSLYKNRGWANYKLGHYQQAEADLRYAASLRDQGDEDKGAAAHCLLGYVLEAQRKPEAADEWETCVDYAPGQKDVEAVWLGYAQEKTRGGATR